LLRGLDPRVQFQIANSIWYRLGFTVEQPFLDANRTYYDARVQALDFTAPTAVPTINAWVNEQTQGKIKEIITGIPNDVVMYLINAIYFKGDWMQQFDKTLTAPLPFHLQDGSTVNPSRYQIELAIWNLTRGSSPRSKAIRLWFA